MISPFLFGFSGGQKEKSSILKINNSTQLLINGCDFDEICPRQHALQRGLTFDTMRIKNRYFTSYISPPLELSQYHLIEKLIVKRT